METVVLIVAVVVTIFAILFVVGGIDNSRPVSSWSDEKLQRMKGKLEYVRSAAMKAEQYESAKQHSDKLGEVLKEIESRQAKKANSLVSQVRNIDAVEAFSSDDMTQLIGAVGNKMAELTLRTMREYSCSEDKAKELIAKKIEDIELELKRQGLTDEQVVEHSLRKVLAL